ncbi:uncharacterized protein LOC115179753 isoform X2 [Salmo trutta]|uniref:uncharacterized protein LOC115179753 isoform X2 n=1 Tax=Salmo trutta TaxID=8032 RepID=UPI00113107E0|nr:uncharacterized protein LOC115179753 isoform X2 [Salmo trutta]
MSKLQLLNVFVTERLSAAAVEIFGVVQKTLAEYQEEIFRSAEENDRLRREMDMIIKSEIQLYRTGFIHLPERGTWLTTRRQPGSKTNAVNTNPVHQEQASNPLMFSPICIRLPAADSCRSP